MLARWTARLKCGYYKLIAILRRQYHIILTASWEKIYSVCPVIDHEFRHNIVKVAVDPRGDISRVDPQDIVFYNNRKVEGTKLSQNARQKCARNFKVYSIWRDQILNSPRSLIG